MKVKDYNLFKKNNNQVSTVIEINEQERQKILLLELQVANLKEITYL
jgi:hypothetical protein